MLSNTSNSFKLLNLKISEYMKNKRILSLTKISGLSLSHLQAIKAAGDALYYKADLEHRKRYLRY